MARKGRASIEVEGGPELRRAFRKLGDRANDLKDVHRDAAELVADRAEQLAPRLSGALADSIRVEARKTGAAVRAGGTRLVPYAGPIHYGWRIRNIEPQPFLTDAASERRSDVLELYEKRVGELVRRFDVEAPDK